jgi:hypothetical protein
MGSKGGGNSSSNNQVGFQSLTSTYRPDPVAYAAMQNALNMASNAASKPYSPYQGALVAGFSPDTMNAMQGVRDVQGIYNPYGNAATALTQQAVDYSDPRNFNAQSLSQFESPYTAQVVDATMANMKQQQAEADQAAQSKAALNGTFNGSGAFQGRAEVARQQALANAQTLGGLRQSAYQQAVNQYTTQQAQAITTAQNAAYGLGQLGQQAQNAALGGINALMSSGQQQQNLAQQQLSGNYAQWQAAQAYPYQVAAYLAGITGGIAPSMGGTTNTTGFGTSNSTQQQSGGGGTGAGLLTSALSMLPSLFGASDREDKTDIKYLGKEPETGEKLYAYRYKDDPKSYPKVIGPMAQDIEQHSPERVAEVGGHKVVAGMGRKHFAEGGAGFGALAQDPSAMNNFVQGIFDPRTADQLARAKWVNQDHGIGDQPSTADNYVIPPSLMQDGGDQYPYNPPAYAPRAEGGALRGFGDLLNQAPYEGGGEFNFIPDPSKFGVSAARDVGRSMTEQGIHSVQHNLPDLPGMGGGHSGGHGGGGEGGKIPELKLPKSPKKVASSVPGGGGEVPSAEPEALPSTESPATAPAETATPPAHVDMGSLLDEPFRFAAAGGGALGVGGGSQADVGSVGKGAGGVGGDAYGSPRDGDSDGLSLGDIVLGKARSPSDAAGFGKIFASQEKLTGAPLMAKWNSEVWANDPGPQKSPKEQGMPDMPSADFYSKPRESLPSTLLVENAGKQNPGLDTNLMALAGAGAGKAGQMLGPIAFGMAASNQAQENAGAAQRADLAAKRTAMLNDPANFPVQGYYTSVDQSAINPRTGLYNVDYLGAYRGMPFANGGRVGLTEDDHDTVLRSIPAIIGAESNGNPSARNRSSSAGGLGQFINDTWLKQARATNPALASVPDKEVLRMKTDASPHGMAFQRAVLHNFTLENATRLRAAGVPVTPENLYSVHFSGDTRIAGAHPNAKMASVMTRAARAANPSIARMTVQQFNQRFASRVPDQRMPQLASNAERPAIGKPSPSPTPAPQPQDTKRVGDFEKGDGYATLRNVRDVPTLTGSEAGMSRAQRGRIAAEAERDAAARRAQFARDFNAGRSAMDRPPAPVPGPQTPPTANLGQLDNASPRMPADGLSLPSATPATGIGGLGTPEAPALAGRDLMGAKPMGLGDLPLNNTPDPVTPESQTDAPNLAPQPVKAAQDAPPSSPRVDLDPTPITKRAPVPAYAEPEPRITPAAFAPRPAMPPPSRPVRHAAPAPIHSTPAHAAPAPRTSPRPASASQPNDWRQQPGFKDDPIRGFFEGLFGPSADAGATSQPNMGEAAQPQQLASADEGNGFFGGLIPEVADSGFGDLFAASRGGFARQHFADGGEADDPLGDTLGAIGEGVSNVASGLGALFSGGEQQATAQPVKPAEQQQPGFELPKFTWSPIQSALLAAGLGMMASRNSNTFGAIGEGGLMGLQAYEDAKAYDDAQQAEVAKQRRAEEFRKTLLTPSGDTEATPEGSAAVTPPVGNKEALALTAPRDATPPALASTEKSSKPIQLAMADNGVMSDAPLLLASNQSTPPDAIERRISQANADYQRYVRAASRAPDSETHRMAMDMANEARARASAAKYELEKRQAAEQRRQAAADREVRVLDRSEYSRYGIPQDYAGPVQLTGSGRLLMPAGAGQPDPFRKKAAEQMADTFTGYSKEGQSASEQQGLLSMAEELSKSVDTGVPALLQKKLTHYGVSFGANADKTQAMDAILARLVPNMRVPGSGATSDFDAQNFERSLPSLRNSPDGNAIIFKTAHAVNEYKMRRADIAERALTGEITPAEATKEMHKLGDPFAAFKEFQQTTEEKAGDTPRLPTVGDVIQHNGANYVWDGKNYVRQK